MTARIAKISRATKETDIKVRLNLDGTGQAKVSTGFGFADHMLSLMTFFGRFDLDVDCSGDLHIDAHHTLEDVALTLGQALGQALGGKEGIRRMASAMVPMDEALAQVVVDLSGRAYLVYREDCLPPVIAGEEKDLWREFFKAFSSAAGMNLHIHLQYGHNGHHLMEAAFKAVGLALRQAVAVESGGVPSTKGSL